MTTISDQARARCAKWNVDLAKRARSKRTLAKVASPPAADEERPARVRLTGWVGGWTPGTVVEPVTWHAFAADTCAVRTKAGGFYVWTSEWETADDPLKVTLPTYHFSGPERPWYLAADGHVSIETGFVTVEPKRVGGLGRLGYLVTDGNVYAVERLHQQVDTGVWLAKFVGDFGGDVWAPLDWLRPAAQPTEDEDLVARLDRVFVAAYWDGCWPDRQIEQRRNGIRAVLEVMRPAELGPDDLGAAFDRWKRQHECAGRSHRVLTARETTVAWYAFTAAAAEWSGSGVSDG